MEINFFFARYKASQNIFFQVYARSNSGCILFVLKKKKGVCIIQEYGIEIKNSFIPFFF